MSSRNPVTAPLVRRAGSWVALCFAWSWGVAAVVYAAGIPVDGYWSLVLAIPFLVGPLLASLVWKRLVVREPIASIDTALRFDGIMILSWFAPVAIVWASALVAHLFGWGTLDLTGGPIVERVLELRGEDAAAKVQEGLAASRVPYALLASFQALIVGLFFYTPLAFAEEIGWRGVLLRELRPLGFWPAALGIGLTWGLWHVPLVLLLGYFPDAPVQGTLVLVGASIPLGALLAWVREAGGTVWAAALAHGVLTALGGFHELVLSGGVPQVVGVTGVAGGIVLLALALTLFARFPAGPSSPGPALAA
ncbi:MAG: CPBP family intramembrane metalloprotease [Pseudomonadota bacterium]|nr:CPBP family intramembrane metalloprotease [Pseudomonadota bacterium]